MNKILLVVLSFCSLNAFGQKIYSTEKDVFESKEIIFYGYDFSHFKLAEGKRLSQGNITKYVPAWIGYLNEHANEEYFQKKLKKEKVTFNFDYTTSFIDALNGNDLVSIMRHSISPDSIQSILNNYQINEKEGIGFVVIVECFDKAEERCTAYFTFFDIASKKIIISDHFGSKKANGVGLTNYWGSGLFATLSQYISDIYRNKLST